MAQELQYLTTLKVKYLAKELSKLFGFVQSRYKLLKLSTIFRLRRITVTNLCSKADASDLL